MRKFVTRNYKQTSHKISLQYTPLTLCSGEGVLGGESEGVEGEGEVTGGRLPPLEHVLLPLLPPEKKIKDTVIILIKVL